MASVAVVSSGSGRFGWSGPWWPGLAATERGRTLGCGLDRRRCPILHGERQLENGFRDGAERGRSPSLASPDDVARTTDPADQRISCEARRTGSRAACLAPVTPLLAAAVADMTRSVATSILGTGTGTTVRAAADRLVRLVWGGVGRLVGADRGTTNVHLATCRIVAQNRGQSRGHGHPCVAGRSGVAIRARICAYRGERLEPPEHVGAEGSTGRVAPSARGKSRKESGRA